MKVFKPVSITEVQISFEATYQNLKPFDLLSLIGFMHCVLRTFCVWSVQRLLRVLCRFDLRHLLVMDFFGAVIIIITQQTRSHRDELW